MSGPLPVLTAVTGPWEAALVTGLERVRGPVTVVRRCADLADLLAVAASGQGRAAVVSADLRGLGGEALSRLALAGVAVVGLVEPGDEGASHRLHQLGVEQVLPADAPAERVAAAVQAAVAALVAPGADGAGGPSSRPSRGRPSAGSASAGGTAYGDPRQALGPKQRPPSGSSLNSDARTGLGPEARGIGPIRPRDGASWGSSAAGGDGAVHGEPSAGAGRGGGAGGADGGRSAGGARGGRAGGEDGDRTVGAAGAGGVGGAGPAPTDNSADVDPSGNGGVATSSDDVRGARPGARLSIRPGSRFGSWSRGGSGGGSGNRFRGGSGGRFDGGSGGRFGAGSGSGSGGWFGRESEAAETDAARGRLVAVWGPAGAPGRTTTAVGLAAEVAEAGGTCLLVDADTYAGSIAQLLGLLDEAPGLATAARAADHGTLDLPALSGLAPQVSPGLRVLTGLASAARWPELRPASVAAVLEAARSLTACTVVDTSASLEQDEELSYDTAAPRRNGVTLQVLQDADVVVAVGSADPVGLQRLVRGLQDLADVVSAAPVVVVNRVRASAVGPGPERAVRRALARYAGIDDPVLVPHDGTALDAAVLQGRTLPEVVGASPVRAAHLRLAVRVGAVAEADARRRGSRPRAAARSDVPAGGSARTGTAVRAALSGALLTARRRGSG